MSSNCLACTDPINACPVCPSGQECVQTARSCSVCPTRICQDTGSSSSSSSSGGTSTGATVGGAIGGVVGVAAVLAALYFFWWRPRGLAASRKRYSKHLSHRQSKVAEKRKSQLSPPGQTDAVTKRSSVHLHMDGAGADGINRRNTSPGDFREGGALTPGRTSEDDNPFGDQNRSSIGDFDDTNSIHTSEFSFRSSHTNMIPIAYIPPHSSSMSIADGQRGAFGESPSERDSGALPPRSQALRASIPTSMASRDSLALAGAEIIELNPLPPVLTLDTPAVPHGTLANGAPIRPPRSPGLDLKLPNTPKVSSPLAGTPVSPGRPQSGGVFPPLPPSSGSPGSSPDLSFLSTSPAGRGMSVLGDPRARSAQSHLSTITTRSGNSTMSYILDPPQIITPVSAQGARRVELQKGQAGLVKIGTGAAAGALAPRGTATPTPADDADPFDDANRASMQFSTLGSHEMSQNDPASGARSDGTLPPSRPGSAATDASRWTATSFLASDEDSVQFLQGQTVTFTTPNASAPGGMAGRGGSSPRQQNTASFASFDVPQSARSSEAFDTGSQVRPLTGTMSAWSSSFSPSSSSPTGVLSPSSSMGTVRPTTATSASMAFSNSRDSTASGMSDGSLLEGIPFLAPTASSTVGGPDGPRNPNTSSVSLGLPVNVTAPIDSGSVTSTPPGSVRAASIGGVDAVDDQDDQDTDPLPAPFLPFAGQRPTSFKPPQSDSIPAAAAGGGSSAARGTSERVQSAAISVRSGFGSGLSQIPFQLGFPSGFGDDGFTDAGEDDDDDDVDMGMVGERDRGSVLSAQGEFPTTDASREPGNEDSLPAEQSHASSLGRGTEQAVAEQSAELSPLGNSHVAPVAVDHPEGADYDDDSNPFGAHAEVSDGTGVADPRASMDSLALAMGLAANLDAEASSTRA